MIQYLSERGCCRKKDGQKQPSVEKTDKETEDEPAASEEADLALGTI